MNKVNKFWFLLVVTVLFYSCANDKNGGVKLLSKLIETAEDSTKVTTLFTYKGTEIVNTDNSKMHIDYSYTNGLITKIVTTNKSNQTKVTAVYTYDKDKLVSLKSSDGFETNYTYTADGSIAYQTFSTDDKMLQIKKQHGILSYKMGNLTKDSRVLDDSPSGILTKNDVSFEYDTKNNPFHNIVGFDKLLNQYQAASVNNSLISVVENSTTTASDDQIISSAKFFKSVFKYDDDNYPIAQITENASSTVGYLKLEYFYE